MTLVYSYFLESYVEKHEASLKILSESFLMQFHAQQNFIAMNVLLITEDVRAVESGDMESFYRNSCRKLEFFINMETEVVKSISERKDYKEAALLFRDLESKGFCDS